MSLIYIAKFLKINYNHSRISPLGPEGPKLAVSRERCLFHVDRMWTSTKGRGSGSCGRMWTEGRGVKTPIFCGLKWMAPYLGVVSYFNHLSPNEPLSAIKAYKCIRKIGGHPFMASTKNHVFGPLSPCPHASTWADLPLPPCGRPHTVDMKYIPLS